MGFTTLHLILIGVKNLIVCLNTYKNLSNFFTNLSKTAKIYVKKFFFSKKVLYLCTIKLKKQKTQKNKNYGNKNRIN